MNLPKLPNIKLFDDSDLKVIQFISTLSLTGREKWAHDQFKPIYKKAKDILLKTQKNVCYYCQKRLPDIHKDDWHIDHIVSIDEDDRHVFTEKNLILACKWCNREKKHKSTLVKKPISVRYSESSNNYRIVHPRYDSYGDHIDILGEMIYTGLTPKGKHTCQECHLERFRLSYITSLTSENRDLVEGALKMLLSNDPALLFRYIKSLP